MPYIKTFIFSIGISAIFWPANVYAQNNISTFGETALAINQSFSDNYSANFAIRSRYFLLKNNTFQYTQQQVDIFHFSTFKLNYYNKLSLGIYYRNRDWLNTGSNETRFIQQFNYTKQTLGVRFGHRLRLEQRMLKTKTILRQRYRFAVDFPLNGEKLDIGEPYLVSAIEGLWSISKMNVPETDLRLASQIGWQIAQQLKLQMGLEYRLEAFNMVAKHTMFILTGAIIKL